MRDLHPINATIEQKRLATMTVHGLGSSRGRSQGHYRQQEHGTATDK